MQQSSSNNDAGSSSAANKEQPIKEDITSQCLSLLSRKDDTSRLVGLAALHSIINRVSNPAEILDQCTKVLSPNFLDRLLGTGASSTQSVTQAKDMVELAINILNVFALTLPNANENQFLVNRAPKLIEVIPSCSDLTIATILQILLICSTGIAGAKKILEAEKLTTLVDLCATNDNAGQILQHALHRFTDDRIQSKEYLQRLLPMICVKLERCPRAEKASILSLLGDLLIRTPTEYLPADQSWASSVYNALSPLIFAAPNSTERRHITIVIAALLNAYPPSLLFSPPFPARTVQLLLQLTTIDLRASFPSLSEQLASPNYPVTSQRLAASFDIISSFITFLISSEDFSAISLEPESLLKLRNDIGETFGLTTEFLRDRWDAVYTGSSGLEPEADPDAPKSLTWDAPSMTGPEKDPLVMAAMRALGIWLKEDEGLRKECGGLVDVFLGLWTKGKDAGVDYRPWILAAFSGVLEEKHGREMFKENKGWKVLWDDLKEGVKMQGEEARQIVLEEAGVLERYAVQEKVVDESWAREAVKIAEKSMDVETVVMVATLAVGLVVCVRETSKNALREETVGLMCRLKQIEEMLSRTAKEDDVILEFTRDALLGLSM
ncbi:Neurochondrin-domain-containing protein [Pyronema omphalodes]|nr:Neurochondrin-domain-containing protein [Pyronema omphalodes]